MTRDKIDDTLSLMKEGQNVESRFNIPFIKEILGLTFGTGLLLTGVTACGNSPDSTQPRTEETAQASLLGPELVPVQELERSKIVSVTYDPAAIQDGVISGTNESPLDNIKIGNYFIFEDGTFLIHDAGAASSQLLISIGGGRFETRRLPESGNVNSKFIQVEDRYLAINYIDGNVQIYDIINQKSIRIPDQYEQSRYINILEEEGKLIVVCGMFSSKIGKYYSYISYDPSTEEFNGLNMYIDTTQLSEEFLDAKLQTIANGQFASDIVSINQGVLTISNNQYSLFAQAGSRSLSVITSPDNRNSKLNDADPVYATSQVVATASKLFMVSEHPSGVNNTVVMVAPLIIKDGSLLSILDQKTGYIVTDYVDSWNTLLSIDFLSDIAIRSISQGTLITMIQNINDAGVGGDNGGDVVFLLYQQGDNKMKAFKLSQLLPIELYNPSSEMVVYYSINDSDKTITASIRPKNPSTKSFIRSVRVPFDNTLNEF